MDSVLADQRLEPTERFSREIVQLRHGLHERPMFSDEGLAALLDRYPRAEMGVFTMGHDIEDWRGWRRGAANGLNGDQLLAAVQDGRLWLNLRHANEHLPEFAALSDEIAAEKEKRFRTRVLKRDLGLLISSPNAQVFYHLDVPYSSLWHLRGEKRISFYPRSEPFVDPAWLERCVHRRAEGQMPFKTDWDAEASAMTLTPGDMVVWPQSMPHRVDNGPMMNVSMSMEFMTPRALVRTNVIYANGLLRERLGLAPQVQEGLGPTMAAKLVLARAHKALTAHVQVEPVLPETFAVDAPQSAAA